MAENRNAQQVREITDKLEQGLKELFESERFKEYLKTMSKFYNYSFNNTILIAMQKPDATLIAGYTAWQRNFDRHVMKGEKGIKILGLKSSYEGITLESAIPCESQAEKWTEKQRDRYFEIASKCDKETLIQHHYTSDCMHKRNRYMVDQADFIIAVWDGRPSGTGKTVQYAQRQGKLVTIINPRTMLVE